MMKEMKDKVAGKEESNQGDDQAHNLEGNGIFETGIRGSKTKHTNGRNNERWTKKL